jgi:hypothetical protein
MAKLSGRQIWYRNVYLRSAHWRAVRQWALALAGNRCARCGRGGRLDVHHLTYERLWAELPGDLEVLCRGDHEAAEGRSRGLWRGFWRWLWS